MLLQPELEQAELPELGTAQRREVGAGIRQQAIEVQTLLSLVQANFGVTLLPASLEQVAPPGVVFRSLTPALPEVPLYAVYRADDDSAVLKLFLDTLRELVAVERESRAALA